ncbi:hypothetical protein LJC32_00025 [Oscillospiraceae bacterium OttesenSCG-928-F05]|nr:hypothetical protein [Oscillospiraceae bacterium OttesenSCG-928-F05]
MSTDRGRDWRRLDNAAKIFPPTTNGRDTNVFRVTCEMKEAIEPQALQVALDRTVERFPLFRSVIKRGIFWYYLEQSTQPVTVEEECRAVCAPLYEKGSKNLLVDVSYYQNRINLEVFHAVSDGSGALRFLKTLVANYITECYPDTPLAGADGLLVDASAAQQVEDSYLKYYDPGAKRMKQRGKAWQQRGAKLPQGALHVIEGIMPVRAVLAEAKKHGVTLTVYLTALYLFAMYEDMPLRHRGKPVVAAVPVDLRNYFPSETAQNFFSLIYVEGRYTETLEEMIILAEQAFKRELKRENLAARMRALMAIERNALVRPVPLVIKDLGLKIAGAVSQEAASFTLSNLGRVEMPAPLREFIGGFGVFAGTDRSQLCVCSYGDRLSIGYTSIYESTETPKRFFRALASAGIPVEIHANRIFSEEGK